MTLTFADYQRNNFFRLPSWRWDRVLNICERYPSPGRSSVRDDKFVRAGRKFFLRWRNQESEADRQKLWFDNQGLFYAYDFYQRKCEDPEAALFLEARLLAQQSNQSIADAMGITPETVEWYETLFFNVADKLTHRDWITKQVLLPAFMRHHGPPEDEDGQPLLFRDPAVARPFMDASLKMFAYFGGVFLTDLMIAGLQHGNPLVSPQDAATWLDKQWGLIIRRRSTQAALQFKINNFNVMELFATHTRIMEIDRSEESREQQKTTTERHIKAMLDGIPWSFSGIGDGTQSTTALGRFEKMPAELRDDEVLRISSGEPVSGLRENWPLALPAPRKKASSVVGGKEKAF